MSHQEPPKNSKPRKPNGVLIVSNDRYLPCAKTSEYLADATRKLGIRAVVRDSYDARYLGTLIEDLVKEDERAEIYPYLTEKFNQLTKGFGVDTVLSLDLQWLFLSGLFLKQEQVQRIHSIWFDDMRSWARANLLYRETLDTFQEHLTHSKVWHHFYGQGLAEEGKLIGMTQQSLSYLAAPEDYLNHAFPCEKKSKVAFIGNPGFRGKPIPMVLEKMDQKADLDEIRKLNALILLNANEQTKQKWFDEEPTVKELLGVAFEARLRFPNQSALQMIQLAGEHYPRAFEYLNEKGVILDAAVLVKLINAYDRPAIMRRLYDQKLVDIYSNETEWEPYGVKALKSIPVPELPRYYQMYPAHLNGANPLRDATANEKLFEMAACARVSVNLHSHDVAECYKDGEEIVISESLEQIEFRVRELLEQPQKALEMGQAARERTRLEHLWEHRLEKIYKT